MSGIEDVLSKGDFNTIREEEQELPPHLPTSILARAHETTTVTIQGVGGNSFDIEIRIMLNKREAKLQSKFFKVMNHLESTDDDYYYFLASSFLDMICIDPELDRSFWSRDDVDPYIIQELIADFIKRYK